MRDVINVQLGEGVDTKTDPKAVDLGDLISSQNLSFASLRGLNKRNGNLLLPTVAGGIGGLAVFNASLIAQSNYGTLYWIDIVNNAAMPIGTMQQMSILTNTIQGGAAYGGNLILSATASALVAAPSASLPKPQGIQVTAWELQGISQATSEIYYQVADLYSGSLIVPPTLIQNGSDIGFSPRCISANNQVVIFWVDSSSGALIGTIITAASPTTKANVTLGATVIDLTNPVYDVTYASDTGRYWLVFKAAAHAIPYVLSVNSTTLATVTAAIQCPGITDNLMTPGTISVAYQGANGFYVFTVGSTGANTQRVNFSVLNNTPASVASGTSGNVSSNGTVGAGPMTTAYGAVLGVTSLNILLQTADTTTPLKIVTWSFNNIGSSSAFLSSGAPVATHLGLHLVSNFYGELTAGIPQSFGVVTWQSPEQATYFVVDQSLRIHGKFLAQTAGNAPDSVRNRLTDFWLNANGGIYNLAVSVQGQITAVNGAIISYNGVQFVAIDFTPIPSMIGFQLGQNIHMTGGQLWNFDGVTLAEHGFHIYPEWNPSSGSQFDAGTFGLIQNQPAINIAGQVTWSIQCPPASLIKNGSYVQIGGFTPGTWSSFIILGIGSVPSVPSFITAANTRCFQVMLSATDSANTVASKIYQAIVEIWGYGGIFLGGLAIPLIPSLLQGQATIDLTFANPGGDGQNFGPIKNNQDFAIAQVTAGAAGAKQEVVVFCNAAKYISAGQYFILQGNTGFPSTMPVWFQIASVGSAPTGAGNVTPLQITLAGTETESQVATAINTAINGAVGAQAIFTSAISANFTNSLVLTDAANGLAAAGGWNVNVGGSLSRTQGTTTPGDYGYAFTYRWTDVSGQVHQSSPSPIVSVPIGPGLLELSGSPVASNIPCASTIIQIPTLRVTDKSNVTIDVWRTIANGSVLYRVTSTSSAIINNNAVDFITYHDTLSDDLLIGSDLLYTTGELPNVGPPGSCLAIRTFQNRLVLANMDDGNLVAISQAFVTGAGLMFNGGLDFRLDPFGGEINAIGIVDGNLIVLKDSQLWVVSGIGPDPLGNGEFSAPQLISGNVGCIGPALIAETQLGVVFVSEKGIYLLDRSLTVNYIGAPVEGIIEPSLVTCVLSVENENEIRFFTATGVTIVWNYFIDPEDPSSWVGKWTTYTIQNGAAAVNWNGSAVFADSVLSAVLMENPGSYLDGSTAFTYQFETGWVDETGKRQGFQHVYQMLLQGQFQVGQAITIDFQYDGDTTYTDTVTWTPAELGNGNFYGGSVYGANTYGGQTTTPEPITSARINPPRRAVSQIKVRVTEATPANLPLSCTALTFEIATIEGVNRTGFANVAG